MKQLFRFPVFLTLIIIIGLSACTSETNQQKKVESKPNIIYILADDMGYADIGCYGQQIIKTPNIDKLADEGMRFTQHYAGSTVCAPSRCALMTGLHMGHAYVRGNLEVEPTGQLALPEGAKTVASYLKEAGYKTALIGKWGLGVEGSTGTPDLHGFDYYYGYLDQILAHNSFPEYLIKNGKKEMLNNEVVYRDSTEYHRGLGSYSTKKTDFSNDLFTEDALKFIEENKDTTFFLYLPYTLPHDNEEALANEHIEIPDCGIYKDKAWPKERKAYAATITLLDEYVGRIMQKLKDNGIDKNTIVLFTSDNGPVLESEFTSFFNSNGLLRGGKNDLYEGGIRIPLIVRWPGKVTAGTNTMHISAFWDFMPTACDLAGVKAPKNSDGISFLPILLNKQQRQHEYLYWEFMEYGEKQAIRKGDWKAVRNYSGKVELFDLSTDISEQNSVTEKYPEIAAELNELMKTARTKSELFPISQ